MIAFYILFNQNVANESMAVHKLSSYKRKDKVAGEKKSVTYINYEGYIKLE